MFIMDMPDVPPQAAPIVVAQASQATRTGFERTIGACQPIENKLESKTSAINNVAPVGPAWRYLKRVEHIKMDESALVNAKVTILQGPAHGTLSSLGDAFNFMYASSDYQYEGQDQATVLVEMGGYKIKVIYYFKLMQNVPGSSDQGTAYDNKAICPNGDIWKISLNPDDPNAPVYHPAHLGWTAPWGHQSGTQRLY